MMKRLLPMLAIAIAAAPPAAAQATQQPPLHLIGSSYGPFEPLGFGGSRGYYDRTARELRIVTPGKPRGYPVATPDGCSGRGISLPDRLLFCETGPSFRILDTNSGDVTPVDTSPCGARDGLNFGELGRYWIGGQEEAGIDHGEVLHRPIYLNRTTGECRRFDPGQVRDVDRPDLPPAPNPSCADAGVRRLLKPHHPGFDVIFCRSKRKPLRVCRTTDCDPVLGRQTVAWVTFSQVTPSRVKAIRLDSGRTFSWRLAPLARRPIQQALVDLLRDRLYVTLVLGDLAPRHRIFSAVLGR
jgi:hypothetical protein